MSLLDSVEGLVVPVWARALLRATPLIVLGLLVGALVFERHEVTTITAQRDRIIRVIDPSGKTSPEQAIVAAQRVVDERTAAKTALTVPTGNETRMASMAVIEASNSPVTLVVMCMTWL